MPLTVTATLCCLIYARVGELSPFMGAWSMRDVV